MLFPYLVRAFCTTTQPKVLFQYHNHVVKTILNKPESLNSTDIDMIKAIHNEVLKWRQDPNLKVLFISSKHNLNAFRTGCALQRS